MISFLVDANYHIIVTLCFVDFVAVALCMYHNWAFCRFSVIESISQTHIVPKRKQNLGEWVIEYAIFLCSGGRKRNEIWHKGSPGVGDDAQTSNTHIAQRKRAIPHSTMKNIRNIRGLVFRTSVMLVTLLVDSHSKLWLILTKHTVYIWLTSKTKLYRLLTYCCIVLKLITS